MKYIVIDEQVQNSGDIFEKEFDDKDKAIAEAANQWDRMTASERGKRTIYVLESINPDEDAENHYDGNVIWEDGEVQE